jgi:outer membrane phospholipase A
MRYVCFATVRREFDVSGATWMEVFVGDQRDDEPPQRIAYRGVADLNGKLRIEDKKYEIVGVTWMNIDNIAPFVIDLTTKYKIAEGSHDTLLAFESTFEQVLMSLYVDMHPEEILDTAVSVNSNC